MSVDQRLRAALRADDMLPRDQGDALASVLEEAQRRRARRRLVGGGAVAAAAAVVAFVAGGFDAGPAEPQPTQPRPSFTALPNPGSQAGPQGQAGDEAASRIRGSWQTRGLSPAEADRFLRDAHLDALADRWARYRKHGDTFVTFVQESDVGLWLGDAQDPYVKLLAVGSSPALDDGFLRLRDDEHTLVLGFRLEAGRLSLHVGHASGPDVAGQSSRDHARALFEPLSFRLAEGLPAVTGWRWPGLAVR
ncbi:MAG: hypothetical protein U0R80_09230 [Nocardioidaceae bacterium]